MSLSDSMLDTLAIRFLEYELEQIPAHERIGAYVHTFSHINNRKQLHSRTKTNPSIHHSAPGPIQPRVFIIRLRNVLKGRNFDPQAEDSEDDEKTEAVSRTRNKKVKYNESVHEEYDNGRDDDKQSDGEYISHSSDDEDDYEDEAYEGPSSSTTPFKRKKGYQACPVSGCSRKNLHCGSVRAHIMVVHPAEFAKYYPNSQLKFFYCPQPNCGMLRTNPRPAYLDDHLAQVHGIDKPERLGVNDFKFLKRKSFPIVAMHFAADGAALNAFKDRIDAAEARLRHHDPGYVSDHGLDLTKRWPTRAQSIEAMGRRDVAAMELSKLRTELSYVDGVKVGAMAKWEVVARRCEADARAADDANVVESEEE